MCTLDMINGPNDAIEIDYDINLNMLKKWNPMKQNYSCSRLTTHQFNDLILQASHTRKQLLYKADSI